MSSQVAQVCKQNLKFDEMSKMVGLFGTTSKTAVFEEEVIMIKYSYFMNLPVYFGKIAQLRISSISWLVIKVWNLYAFQIVGVEKHHFTPNLVLRKFKILNDFVVKHHKKSLKVELSHFMKLTFIQRKATKSSSNFQNLYFHLEPQMFAKLKNSGDL